MVAVADLRGTPLPGPTFFNFMQFLENLVKLYVGAPPPPVDWRSFLWGILDQPLVCLLFREYMKISTTLTYPTYKVSYFLNNLNHV